MSFNISEKNGKNFSRLSGDFNKIHIDQTYSRYSLFGEPICHGCNVLYQSILRIKEFTKIFKKKKFCINIKFNNYFSYNKKISIRKLQNKYYLIQDGKQKSIIKLNKPTRSCIKVIVLIGSSL